MSEQVRRKLKVAMQENARLKSEVERLTADNDARQKDMNLMFEEIQEGRRAYHRLYHLHMTAKGVQS